MNVNPLIKAIAEHTRLTGTRLTGTAYLTKGDGTGTLVVPSPLRARECYVWQEDPGGSRVYRIVVLDPNANILYENNTAYENVQVQLGKYPGDETEYVLRLTGHAGLQAMPVTPTEQKINAMGFPPVANISTLRAAPTDPASMLINVDGPFGYLTPSTGAPNTYSATTYDATSDVPGSSNQHRLGLLCLDPTSGSLVLVRGTAATASGTVPSRSEFTQSDYSAIKPGYYFPIEYVYLYYGQTTVTEDDLMRDYCPRLVFSNFTPHLVPIRVVTAAGAVTVTTSDYLVVVKKTVGAATTVNLPSSPATGLTFVIKDGKGDAATNNITITPAAGNIDGAGTKVINTNYAAVTVTYNGTEWSTATTTSGGTVYYQTVQGGGTPVTQRSKLNFIAGNNTGITVADDSGNDRTNVTVDSYPVTDITATAGEALSARDACYINPSDNKIYKLDTDATGPVKVSAVRGIVPSAISSGASGTLRVFGVVTGFSSLTAGGDVWYSSTAGGYTQTKPSPSAGAAQIAVIRMGYAVSTTDIMVYPTRMQFVKRASLANNGTLTIEHYTDGQARSRRVAAYIASTSGSANFATYASSNYDQDVALRGPTGSGGTTTITASGNTSVVGSYLGTTYDTAQSFQVTAGYLSQFTVTLAANTGSPTGTLTWEIQTDSGGLPSGTVLATGTFTPTPSATNTITVSNGPYLAASTSYWLVLKCTSAQTGTNYFAWQNSSGSVYANGTQAQRSGGTWSTIGNDCQCAITTGAATVYDKLGQSFQGSGSATITKVQLYLKKTGTPAGTMTLRIETNSGSAPSGTLADANATVTVAESSVSTTIGLIDFTFSTPFTLSGSTTYWIVLSTDRTASNSNYIQWGTDASSPGYASGNWATNASSTWTADTNKDGVFTVVQTATSYDEPCVIGRDSGGTRDVAVRFDDGAGTNGDTQTTFKNVIGSTSDLMMEVDLA